MNKDLHKKQKLIPYSEWDGTLIAYIQKMSNILGNEFKWDRGQTGMERPMGGINRAISKYNNEQEEENKRPDYQSQTYGDIEGEDAFREKTAHYSNILFELSDMEDKFHITKEDVLFSIGSLHAIIAYSRSIEGNIVCPSPYYINYDKTGKMRPINILKDGKVQRFTAKTLKDNIKNTDGAILFNDPNNPFGTKMTREEIKGFVELLKDYPNIKIMFDLAYFGIDFTEEKLSPVKVFLEEANEISPEYAEQLKERTSLFVSTTKSSGHFKKRGGFCIIPDEKIREKVKGKIENEILGIPEDCQLAATATVEGLVKSNRTQEMSQFYGEGARYASYRLKKMGAMPEDFNVEGGLFTAGNFHSLMGQPIPEKAQEMVGEGVIDSNMKLVTSLMAGMYGEKGITLIPINPEGKDGMVRIFFGASLSNLKQGMDVLERIKSKALSNDKSCMQL